MIGISIRRAQFAVGDSVRIYNDTVKPGRCPKCIFIFTEMY